MYLSLAVSRRSSHSSIDSDAGYELTKLRDEEHVFSSQPQSPGPSIPDCLQAITNPAHQADLLNGVLSLDLDLGRISPYIVIHRDRAEDFRAWLVARGVLMREYFTIIGINELRDIPNARLRNQARLNGTTYIREQMHRKPHDGALRIRVSNFLDPEDGPVRPIGHPQIFPHDGPVFGPVPSLHLQLLRLKQEMDELRAFMERVQEMLLVELEYITSMHLRSLAAGRGDTS